MSAERVKRHQSLLRSAAIGFVTFERDASSFDEVMDGRSVCVDVWSAGPSGQLVSDSLCRVGVWRDDEYREFEIAPNRGNQKRVLPVLGKL